MAYDRTWDAAYEADPSDSGTNVSVGADRIRDSRTDIRQRMEKDHYMAIAGTDVDHGEHSKVTLQAPLGSDPAPGTNKGAVYTKDIDSKVELHFQDEDGNVVIITKVGALQAFPAGTVLPFGQNSPPTGWTRQTTGDTIYDAANDNAMFCFAKTGNIGQAGAADPQAVHKHTGPSHNHQWYNHIAVGTTGQTYASNGSATNITNATSTGVSKHLRVVTTADYALNLDGYTTKDGTGDTGENDAPYYVELILAVKD